MVRGGPDACSLGKDLWRTWTYIRSCGKGVFGIGIELAKLGFTQMEQRNPVSMGPSGTAFFD